MHTEVSHDCETTLQRVVDQATRAGLDCIAITDHGSIDGALRLRELAPPTLDILVGCEYDTSEGPQVIGLGVDRVIREARLLPLLEAIREAGGQTLLPHPFRRGGGVFAAEREPSAEYVDAVLALTDMVESFNGRDHADHNRASHRLVLERGLAGVAGSDAHMAHEIGSVYVEYAADDREHGRSRRGIHYPDHARRAQSRVRRGLMGSYHRLEPHLPRVVARGYRSLRRRLDLDRGAPPSALPRPQYELPSVGLDTRVRR